MFSCSARILRVALGTSIGLTIVASASAQTFVAAPASRNPNPDKPRVELKIYESRPIGTSWSGSGKNVISADICVASSTGRFRLRILSIGGGKMISPASRERLSYTVRFRDGAGQEQEKRVNGNALVTFDGASAQYVDCTRGANSKIEIDMSESDLVAHAAGRYFDELLLSADPL